MPDRFHILLVDDDPTVITLLGRALSELGHLRFATSGADALRMTHEAPPDLVLLDVELPDTSGYDVCRAMKADPALAEIPVIFITGHDDLEQELRGLELGAVDFISKPPRAPLVLARVRTHLRLKQMSDALRKAATIDALTGVANRRLFDETIEREWSRARRGGRPMSLMLVDLDSFKAYNDRYGHPGGDACLRRVATTLAEAARRPADLVARYGGEEFAVLLPETNAVGARRVAQMLVERVEALGLPHAGSPVSDRVTVSIGVTSYDETCQSWIEPSAQMREDRGPTWPPTSWLVSAADQALYMAKQNGRRQACFLGLDHRGTAQHAYVVPVDPPSGKARG